MKCLEPFQLLFLDFDGVILESVDIKTRAFAALYEPYGPKVVQEVIQHHTTNGGMNRINKFRHYHQTFLGQELEDHELNRLCEAFTKFTFDEILKAPLVPGIEDFLKNLPTQIPAMVISATPHGELLDIIEMRGMNGWFCDVYGFPPAKADTIRALLVNQRTPAKKALFIGDAINDYNAAHETGVAFWGRLAPNQPNPFPPGIKTFKNFSELS